MSTIAVTAPISVRRTVAVQPNRLSGRPSAAVYRRRRIVVDTIAAFLVVLAGLAVNELLTGDGGVTASAAVAGPALERTTVTAQPGDTMWGLARAHHGDVNFDRYLDRLIALNGGVSIQAGQAVLLP